MQTIVHSAGTCMRFFAPDNEQVLTQQTSPSVTCQRSNFSNEALSHHLMDTLTSHGRHLSLGLPELLGWQVTLT